MKWAAVEITFCVAALSTALGLRWLSAELNDDPEFTGAGAVVYVPRCCPAFAGRALVCVDAPRVRTVEVLP